jgi:hypothetical protein
MAAYSSFVARFLALDSMATKMCGSSAQRLLRDFVSLLLRFGSMR